MKVITTINSKRLGEVVAEWRRASGLSQDALAKRLGMKQSAICRLELGKHEPTARTIVALSRAMKINAGTLFNLLSQ